MLIKPLLTTQTQKGFTLVELVVGIVVLAIAMMVMNTMLISQSKDALQPVYRLRASQLGQGILQDILTRSYDEHSDHNGGYYRCGEIWQNGSLWYDVTLKKWMAEGVPDPTDDVVLCTAPAKYGPEGDEIGTPAARKHSTFNDVDDFITSGFVNAVIYGDLLGQKLSPQYNNYSVKIALAAYSQTPIAPTMKRIHVTIETPSGEQIVFSALKGNY